MIEWLLSVVGGGVALGGLMFGAWRWLLAKAPSTIGSIGDVVESIKLPPTFSANDRLSALQDAEALMRYFEETKNTAGQAALKSLVGEIFTAEVKL